MEATGEIGGREWPIAILPTENRTVRPPALLQYPRSVEATVETVLEYTIIKVYYYFSLSLMWCSSYYTDTPHKGQSGRLPFFLSRSALPAPQSRPNASVLGRLRSGGARTRWPFAGRWANAQTKGAQTASRGGLRSRIRAPRKMADHQAFGRACTQHDQFCVLETDYLH